MMNREMLRNQLIIDEGIVHEIYPDPLGYPTFGIGHFIMQDDPEYGKPLGTPVSQERVYEVFEEDIDESIDECRFLYGYGKFDNFPGEVQEILVNMMFNLGRTKLSKFRKMNAHLQCHEWVSAAAEGRDSLWYRQVTNRAERLMSRLEKVS